MTNINSLDEELKDWLLDSDPSIRWQVERDLLGASDDTWRATRDRVATEGFGAALLAKQDADGQWAGGAHFPGRHNLGIVVVGNPEAQPWVATSWSLNHLREWGVPAEALGDTADKLEANCTWEYDDLPFWNGEVDVCINAWTLMNGLWLGRDLTHLAQWFLDHQLEDGGWNCEWESGSTRSSFHSTLNALIALLDWQIRTGDSSVEAARHRGEEYLLSRRLLNRATTGASVGDFTDEFIANPRHRYSALRALDYFRAASEYDGSTPDPRLADAIELVKSKRQDDGRWLQDGPLDGIVWLRTEEDHHEPSKAVTLAALRVLAWHDGHAAGRATS